MTLASDLGQTTSAQPETVSASGSVDWFAELEIHAALAHAAAGNVALHFFRYDLRRYGLGIADPACHVIAGDRSTLGTFLAQLGIPERAIKPPRPHRPHIWHADVFGIMLTRLQTVYPPARNVDADPAPAISH